MKFNIKNVFVLLGCIAIMSSCQKDEGDISTVTEPQKYTFTSLTEGIVVPEEAATYEIAFTFDDKQIYDAHVLISPSSESTATEDADYHLSAHSVDVGTLAGSGSFSITVDEDFEPEGDETVILTLAGDAPFNLPEAQTKQFLTIQNKIYPPAIMLEWDDSFDYFGSTFTICDDGGVDVDLFFTDVNGDFAGGFGGATGSCQEMIFIDGLADGVYNIEANLYGNGLLGVPSIDTVPYPLDVTLFKGGVVSPAGSTLKYDATEFAGVPTWTTYTDSDPDGVMNAIVGSISVTGGEVTLIDPSGAIVGKLN